MKIIISPSKKQNRECVIDKNLVKPFFKSKSDTLRKKLEDLDKNELSQVLDIKGNLLEKTQKSYSEPEESKAAICCYNGLVFKQLDIKSYTNPAIDYMEKNLFILSAIYGVLTPLTVIKPYRLDMKAKFKDLDLYDYWQEDMDALFKDEDLIINLASNEFSKMLNYEAYNGRFVDIDFKEVGKNGKLRTVAARAKKARGLMVDVMIKNQIKSLEDIEKIEVLEYFYDSKLSSKERLVFIRE
jgi:hypothetical protein